MKFGLVLRAGPAGRFPGTAVHGLGIPAGSKNKEAAWAFIQWALSKQTTGRAVPRATDRRARRSDIDRRRSARSRSSTAATFAKLSLDSIELAAKTGHMKYCTVSVYPQVDQQLNKAIELDRERTAVGQAGLPASSQANTIAELKRSGAKL